MKWLLNSLENSDIFRYNIQHLYNPGSLYTGSTTACLTKALKDSYTIVTNTIITSIYLLNSARKYRSNCHQSGNKIGKRKDVLKTNISDTIYTCTYQYIMLITNKLLHLFTI